MCCLLRQFDICAGLHGHTVLADPVDAERFLLICQDLGYNVLTDRQVNNLSGVGGTVRDLDCCRPGDDRFTRIRILLRAFHGKGVSAIKLCACGLFTVQGYTLGDHQLAELLVIEYGINFLSNSLRSRLRIKQLLDYIQSAGSAVSYFDFILVLCRVIPDSAIYKIAFKLYRAFRNVFLDQVVMLALHVKAVPDGIECH